MKTTNLILLLLMSIVTISSCTKTESEFAGDWSGTYYGPGEDGTWKITVSDDRTVTGTVSSNADNVTYNATGGVTESGSFSLNVESTTSNLSFIGRMEDDRASGSWDNSLSLRSGGWAGDKL